jgi:hypothetical protein
MSPADAPAAISDEAQQRFKIAYAEMSLMLIDRDVTITVLRKRLADLQARYEPKTEPQSAVTALAGARERKRAQDATPPEAPADKAQDA